MGERPYEDTGFQMQFGEGGLRGVDSFGYLFGTGKCAKTKTSGDICGGRFEMGQRVSCRWRCPVDSHGGFYTFAIRGLASDSLCPLR